MPAVIAFIAEAWAALEAIHITATITLATIVANVAVSAALSAVASLLVSQKRPHPHAQRDMIRNPVAPRRRYYGRVKVSGVYMFLAVKRTSFETFDNVNTLHIVLALGQGEFDGFEEHWLLDAQVFMNDEHVVVMPRHYYQVGDEDPAPFIRIFWHEGSESQTADTLMTDNWPGQWTSEFRGQGVPYIVMAMFSPLIENFNDVFPAGLPSYSTVVRGSKIWDPRDPAQSFSDPETWTWSQNGALVLLDAVWNQDGLRLPIEMILPAIAVWQMEADYCDQWRDLKNGGSERWFRLSGGYELDDAPKQWLPRMLAPMDARLSMRGDGLIVPDVGRWREPELTFTDNEVYSYSNFARGKAKADIRNKIDATFISPDYDYVEQQADPWFNEDSIDIDGLQTASLDLGWCPSHAQSRLCQKIEAFRQDPEGWNGTIVTNAYGLKFLTPNADGSRRRFGRLVLSEFGLNSTFEMTMVDFDHKSGRCTFAVNEMTAAAFDWDKGADEGIAPAIPATQNTYGFEDPFNLQVTVAGSAITATIATPEDTDLNLSLEYRINFDPVGDNEANWRTITTSGWGGTTGTLSDGRYDVRVRLYNSQSPPRYSNIRAIRGVKIGNGIPDQSIDPPTDFDITDAFDTDIRVEFTAPSNDSLLSCTVYYAAGGSAVFADATPMVTLPVTPSEAFNQLVDFGGVGTFSFFITARNIFGKTSDPVGPVVATISA